MEKALKLLPLGTSDFENLRHRDQIYVDKTDMICELASVPGKFFFARPRRFGKSLLLSTFESLFRDGLKNFQGLKIEQLWTDKSTYKVIKLDFSRVKPEGTFEDFCQYFDNYLEAQFSLIGFKKEDNGLFLSNQIEIFLAGLSSSSLVLLIDEYVISLKYANGLRNGANSDTHRCKQLTEHGEERCIKLREVAGFSAVRTIFQIVGPRKILHCLLGK